MSGLTREMAVSLERQVKAERNAAAETLLAAKELCDGTRDRAAAELALLRTDTSGHVHRLEDELYRGQVAWSEFVSMGFFARLWWFLTGKTTHGGQL